MDVTRHSLVGEAWVPRSARGAVDAALHAAADRAHAAMGTIVTPLRPREMPPTYFNTDKVGGFKGIRL